MEARSATELLGIYLFYSEQGSGLEEVLFDCDTIGQCDIMATVKIETTVGSYKEAV